MSPLSRAVAALALLALAACSQQGPAEKAVDAAESALAAVHEDAVKYVPDEYKAVKADLDRARESIKAGKCAQALAAGGAEELVVHARTKADAYRPPAYWERVNDIRLAVNIPVVANGEIWLWRRPRPHPGPG